MNVLGIVNIIFMAVALIVFGVNIIVNSSDKDKYEYVQAILNFIIIPICLILLIISL